MKSSQIICDINYLAKFKLFYWHHFLESAHFNLHGCRLMHRSSWTAGFQFQGILFKISIGIQHAIMYNIDKRSF